ncbi:MAG: hypothetical protein L0H54_11475, partial [Alcaligenaceae bacterium]|nr:hypothetical protein [Alcaligenaceae bacterium]
MNAVSVLHEAIKSIGDNAMIQKSIFNPRAIMASVATAGLLFASAAGAAETLKIGVIAALTGGG